MSPFDRTLESEPVERKFQECKVSQAVGEARARDLRRPRHVNPTGCFRQFEVIAHREGEGGFLSDLSEHGEIILAAVGYAIRRGVRHTVEQVLSLAFQLGQFGLALVKLLLSAGKLLERLLRRSA
jgi:hypothetical protein